MAIPNFKPHGPWVYLKVDPPKNRTKGGLYLLDGNMEQRLGHLTGTVLSVGPGRFSKKKKSPKYEPHDLKVGDKVIFRGFLKEAQQPFEDRSVCLLHLDDVIGVLT